MKYLKLFILLFSLTLFSCDKIEEGNRLKNVGVACEECSVSESDNFVTEKKAFIEEFTGVTCNNCPKATDEAKAIVDANPNKVVVLGIHASNFSVPNPDEGYLADFRTEIGDEYYKFVDPFGVPSGLINRLGQSTQTFAKPFFSWATEVGTIINPTSTAKVGLYAEAKYDASDNSICLQAKFKTMSDLSGENIYWTAYIAESGIVAAQKQPDNSKKEDYVHNHVLRGGFNGTWGEPIPDFTGAVNSLNCSSRQLTKAADWNKDHLEVIIFAYDFKTYEILQTIEIPVE